MKVIIEYNNQLDASIALQAQTYLQFIEDFENFLDRHPPAGTGSEFHDKWSILKDLYKI